MKKDDLVSLWNQQSQGLSKELMSKLLIPTGRGGVYASRDYVKANSIVATVMNQNPLVDLSTFKDLKELLLAIDSSTRFKLKYYSPCLSYRYDELKPDAQKQVFTDPNWVFTEKENGVRGWIIYNKGVTKFFSRNYSDKDCSVPEYWGNIFQFPSFPEGVTVAFDCEVRFDAGFLLDEELERFGLTTDSKLEAMSSLLQMNQEGALEIQRKFKEDKGFDLISFRVIHPLFFKNINFIDRPLGEGMKYLDELIEYCQKGGINAKPIQRCEGNKEQKEAFLDSIINTGGEGIVAHYKLGKYNTTDNRTKDSFLKLKRSVGAQASGQGMGDQIDGWISGFKLGTPGTANEGLVSAFEVSIILMDSGGNTKDHVIAYVPNITREMQLEITEVIDGKPQMKKDMYGMVVECDGQAISKVSKRLTHPRMIRMRADKDKYSCIYTESFIESQIDANSN